MASATFARKVEVLNRGKDDVIGAIQSSKRRRGFSDIKQTLKLQTMGSSLAKASRRLGDVYDEIDGDVKVNVGKKKKAAYKELSSIMADAMELSRKEGKLHKKKNLKKLARLVSRLENLESQLSQEQLPNTYGALCEVREKLESDHEKFSPESHRRMKEELKLLQSALDDIRKGATMFSLNPFALFRDKTKHPRAISMMGDIIDAMKMADEITDRKPKSIKPCVHEAVRLSERLDDTLMALNAVYSKLDRVDYKKPKLDLEMLKPGSSVSFFDSPKKVDPGEVAARIVELNLKLDGLGLQMSESSSGELSQSRRSITKGEYFSGSITTTREMSRDEARQKMGEARKPVATAGFKLTEVDLSIPMTRKARKVLKVEEPKELTQGEKAKVVSKASSEHRKLKAQFESLSDEIRKEGAGNPIVKYVLTMKPEERFSPLALLSNAVRTVGEKIGQKREQLGMGASPEFVKAVEAVSEKARSGGSNL